MEGLLNDMLTFFDSYGIWIAAGSVAMFVVSLASIPLIVSRIPTDYFHHHHRHRLDGSLRHPLAQLLLVILKNLLGLTLLVAGFIMLFTPGQGLLSILFGLMIMNYPGKYRLERWIVGRPMILSAINGMREKRGKPPLLAPLSG